MLNCYGELSNLILLICFLFFFFQAEDGIRDVAVTGVQTCALPIYRVAWRRRGREGLPRCARRHLSDLHQHDTRHPAGRSEADRARARTGPVAARIRSEERRVGKECRSWWWAYD